MKKTILTLLVAIGSLMSSAQDTIPRSKIFGTPTTNLFGVEMGLTFIDDHRQEVSFINSNITLPQRITDEYYIIHYVGAGYSFSSTNLEETNDDAYVFSYGVGIPLPKGRSKGRFYIYLIDAYHYRPNLVVEDPNDRDFRQRRITLAYRTNKFELSLSDNLFRLSTIFGISYKFGK